VLHRGGDGGGGGGGGGGAGNGEARAEGEGSRTQDPHSEDRFRRCPRPHPLIMPFRLLSAFPGSVTVVPP